MKTPGTGWENPQLRPQWIFTPPLPARGRERGGPGHGDRDSVRGEALQADDEAAAQEGGAAAEGAAGCAAGKGAHRIRKPGNTKVYILKESCAMRPKSTLIWTEAQKNIFCSECVQFIMNHMSLLALCSMSLHLPKNVQGIVAELTPQES